MQIYKLFSKKTGLKNFSLSDFNTSFVSGSTDFAFGLKIEPEKYREFMKSISSYLLKNKINQHIMTDFKFHELIKSQKIVDFFVTDISFYNESEFLQDEVFIELKEALWKSDTRLILELTKEMIDNDCNIFSISGNLKRQKDESSQIFKIYANGTISMEEVGLCEEGYPIIDFLVNGPSIL